MPPDHDVYINKNISIDIFNRKSIVQIFKKFGYKRGFGYYVDVSINTLCPYLFISLYLVLN